MAKRATDLHTIAEVERELDQVLRDLRNLQGTTNIMAMASCEYRVGALRRRKAVLERA